MEREAAAWRYEQLHKDAPFHDGTFPDDPDMWSKDRTADRPYHFNDGVRLWVANRDLAPHDHFLGGAVDCEHCNPEQPEEVDELGHTS